jgi:uncharacterized protein YkwD
VDNQLITFDVDPQIIQGRTLVPLRQIFEYFGADVTWDGETRTVTASTTTKKVQLGIGESTAYVNDKPVILDVPAIIISSRTMVPLRFISESLGAKVEWNGDTRTVLITTAQISDSTTNSEIVTLGQTLDEVKLKLGNVDRIIKSMYGFDWNVFHDDYLNFNMVGIQNNKVVAIYSMVGIEIDTKAVHYGDNRSNTISTFGRPIEYISKGSTNYYYNESDIDLFKVSNAYVRVFYDLHENETVTAVLLTEASVELAVKGYYGPPTDELRDSFEKQLFDLANAERKLKGLRPFDWAQEVVPIARAHSQDMIDRNFFAHVNPSGLSPHERLENGGLSYSMSSENIASGQISAIFAHEDFMNSLGHRKAILGNTQRLGTGVAFGGTSYQYYTENFYTPY